MKPNLNKICLGDQYLTRVGEHTNSNSPKFGKWTNQQVSYVQKNNKGEVILFVIAGFEISIENFECWSDTDTDVCMFCIENNILEIKM